MEEPADLASLLIDLLDLDDECVERIGRDRYQSIYLLGGRLGVLPAHDGSGVFFFPGQFDHAFFTSSDRARHPDRKDRISRERVARVGWIKELIAGRVAPSACWAVDDRKAGRGARREYVVETELYVVWLVARRDGGYRFESAYPALGEDLSRYARLGRKIWSRK
jgi:hypothetical protein